LLVVTEWITGARRTSEGSPGIGRPGGGGGRDRSRDPLHPGPEHASKRGAGQDRVRPAGSGMHGSAFHTGDERGGRIVHQEVAGEGEVEGELQKAGGDRSRRYGRGRPPTEEAGKIRQA